MLTVFEVAARPTMDHHHGVMNAQKEDTMAALQTGSQTRPDQIPTIRSNPALRKVLSLETWLSPRSDTFEKPLSSLKETCHIFFEEVTPAWLK